MKRTLYITLGGLLLASCSQAPVEEPVIKPPSPVQQHYNRYLHLQPYKAYAVAIDEEGDIATGYGYKYKSQIDASRRALQECTKQLAVHQVDTDCEIYAVGNSRISDRELP